ncbi:MAG: biotin/lipoyl-binding protein [Prevotella sp.]|nr:biotin/lipoyl-binding protein [Prevotella sp.]MBQ8701293.1 biotin/lipoyl-binding protein [Prevotella sp.]MBQ9650965.1 biotin/lipoyl-binding protein [Prevotella sp.]
MKYQYTVQGVDYDVEIQDVEGNVAKVTVNGIPFEVETKQPIKAAPKATKVKVAAPKPAVVAAPQPTPAAQPAAQAPTSGTKVTAPLPGTITEVKVAVGQQVKEGETVIVLEAMKMQNNIEAETTGTITAVLVKQGDTVMEGSVLVTIG